MMRITGVVLIGIGGICLAVGGITYTKREKVLDIGPLQASTERQRTIPLPPLLGGLALVGGVALMIAGSRKRYPRLADLFGQPGDVGALRLAKPRRCAGLRIVAHVSGICGRG